MPSTDLQPSPSSRPGLIHRALRRHWIAILATSLLVDLAAGYLIFQEAGPTYRALNLLRVDPTVTDLYNVRSTGDSLDPFLQTQVQLITSPNVLTAAGANPKAAVLERVQKAGDIVLELRKVVSVSVIPGTYLIEVSMTSNNAYECATIVNAVVDAFMEANSEWSDGMTRAQIKNLEQYSVDLKNQTDELERKWKRLASRGAIDSIDGDVNQALNRLILTVEEYRSIYQQEQAVNLELVQARAWLTSAKEAVQKAAGKPTLATDDERIMQQNKRRFQTDPEASAVAGRIREAEAKIADAQRIANAEDPAIRTAKRNRDALMAQYNRLWEAKQATYLAANEAGNADPEREVRDAETIVNKLQARLTALAEQLKAREVKNDERATDSVEIVLIREQHQLLKGMQEAVIRRLEQLRYEAKGEARIRPVNPNGAMVPKRPISDGRPLYLSIVPIATFALIFAFFIGVEAWPASKDEPNDGKPEVDRPVGG